MGAVVPLDGKRTWPDTSTEGQEIFLRDIGGTKRVLPPTKVGKLYECKHHVDIPMWKRSKEFCKSCIFATQVTKHFAYLSLLHLTAV